MAEQHHIIYTYPQDKESHQTALNGAKWKEFFDDFDAHLIMMTAQNNEFIHIEDLVKTIDKMKKDRGL